MDDVPSHDPAYRELRLLLGRIKKLRIDPKHSTRPFHDYAIIYCGWQHSRDGRRRIILLEGLSALGTTGAAKAFCQTSIPACLTDVQDYFLVHHTTLDLGTAGQNNARCCATPKKQRVAAVLPWNWEDVVVGEIKYVQAVAPLARSG